MNSKPLVVPIDDKDVAVVPVWLAKEGSEVEAVGQHEVVIESRRHNVTLALMTPGEVMLVLQIWRQRGRAILEEEGPRFTRFIQIYKNHGAAAGASQAHAHSQIVGLGMIPNDMAHYISLSRIFAEENHGACVHCNEIHGDGAAARTVMATDKFLAIVPFVAESGRRPRAAAS